MTILYQSNQGDMEQERTAAKDGLKCSKFVHLFLLNKICIQILWVTLSGVYFTNCFAPCADLLRPGPNICASKKLLKSWAQGAKVGRKGAKPFMKSTPGPKNKSEK